MRPVVHFTDSTLVGGAERAMFATAEELRVHGWDPIVMHAPSEPLAALDVEARQRDIDVCHVRALPEGVEGLRAVFPLVRTLRTLRPDVFHAHLTWQMSCKYALLAALLARIPAVIATLQLAVDVRLTAGQRLQQHVVTSRVDRYIAVSHGVAQHLVHDLAISPHKVTVVHNGIPVDRFDTRAILTPGTPDARTRILIPARLDVQKGHRYALAALTSVPDAVLLLAGEGPERAALEAQVRDLDIADRVHFLGQRDDVPELLATCDIVCLPSLYEGLPLALLEAMAAGRAVVASAIPGVDELVTDGVTGILVPPGDTSSLAGALRHLGADAVLRSRLGAAARRHVRDTFTLQKTTSQIDAVYRTILSGSASHA